jgi:hypothetical protein
MNYVVRLNEIKLNSMPGEGAEVWRRHEWKYVGRGQLRVVYSCSFGKVIDVVCSTRLEALETMAELENLGVPRKVMRVVSERASSFR